MSLPGLSQGKMLPQHHTHQDKNLLRPSCKALFDLLRFAGIMHLETHVALLVCGCSGALIDGIEHLQQAGVLLGSLDREERPGLAAPCSV